MIEESVQNELRAKFNPDGSNLRKLQMKLLDILIEIDYICRKHNIKYWLSGGSMLGAIRHEGFIPWDDDIDIEMYDDDYKKFCAIAKKEGFSNSSYKLQNHSTDSNYLGIITKVVDTSIVPEDIYNQDCFYKYRGIFVDVFPVHRENKAIYNCFKPCARLLGRLLILSGRNKIFLYIGKIFRFIVYSCFLRLISFITKPFANGYYMRIGSRWKSVSRDKNMILPLKEYIFENHHFYGPSDSSKYLTGLFGDYMKLPEAAEIKQHVILK